MSSCLILGGNGYVGHNWAKRLSVRKRFDRIVLADVRPPSQPLPGGGEFVRCDVREPLQFGDLKPDWIFNFAAVHREPGHAREEYFDTNLPGARNVCAFAERAGCKNIFFASSISVYGPTSGPTSESSPLYPNSPYGISKLAAELIHEIWQAADPQRRLLICRPAVIYGPGDPGNILRMIRAIQKGYFIYPGSKTIRKSYAYIEGLLESFEFAMARPEYRLAYNYAERETETLEGLVRLVQRHLGKKTPSFTAPLPLLVAAAEVVQWLTRGRSPLHPARVRKATLSTHIVPATLLKLGFDFRYGFAASLQDWASKSPGDFMK
jgi:nucleoside-diphosphate-sugar epimerase